MNAKTVADVLDVLAARFGTTVAHLWVVLVRQVYVDAIVNGAVALILSVSAFFAARTAYRWWTVTLPTDQREYGRTFADNHDGLAISVSVGACILVVLALIADGFAVSSFAQLANPEYGALKLIGAALNPSK